MLSYGDKEATVKERYFGRIESIWELNYCGELVPMFRVRWAKDVVKEGQIGRASCRERVCLYV